MFASTSMIGIPSRTPERIASKQAPSASGSQNSWPSESSMETPRSGSRIATAAVAAFAAAAISSPIRRFSSTLVRRSVMFGFHW